MTSSFVARGALAGLGLAAATFASYVVGCSATDQGRGLMEHASAARANILRSTSADGGASADITVPQVFVPTATDILAQYAGQNVYALRIGANYHPVTGCSLTQMNQAIDQPLNTPAQVAEATAESVGTPRARLSCADGDYGELAPDTTPVYMNAGRTYLATGTTAGEYYSFGSDGCAPQELVALETLENVVFKIGSRISDYSAEVDTAPPDLQNEVKISCAPPVTVGNGIYNLYISNTGNSLPGADPNGSYDAQIRTYFAVFESVDAQGRSTYLPVHQVNDQPIVSEDPNNPAFTPDFVALAAWFGINITPELVLSPPPPLASLEDATARSGVRFWDLCVPTALRADGGAPSCTFQHFLYPSATGAVSSDGGADGGADGGPSGPPALPRGYKETLELEGTYFEELLDNPTPKPFSPFFPAFVGCEGSFEGSFGIQRDGTPADARAWVAATKKAVILKTTSTDPRFRCPASTAYTCSMAIGDPQIPTETIPLRTLNRQIAAAAAGCSRAADTLEITLNSNINVTLLPLAGVSFDRFRSVNVVGAGPGPKQLLFKEECDSLNPCERTSFVRTRTVIPMTSDMPTRNLRLENVWLDYTADDLTDAGANFFNLSVILINAQGCAGPVSATCPKPGHVRVVFVDSKVGADPATSQKFVSQSLSAASGDVFVVRSAVGGTADPASYWKALQVSDSLVVLAGTTKGVGTAATQTSVVGGGGGLRFSDGKNDVLAVNALVQAPVMTNAVSESELLDTTLQRSPGKEVIHFVGADTIGAPPTYQMWLQRASFVTDVQLKSPNTTVPFVMFESTLPPVLRVAASVQFFDPDAAHPVTQAALAAKVGGLKLCSGNGTWDLMGLIPQEVCLKH